MAVASAWSKPGSWALDSESSESTEPAVTDFPTLAAAAVADFPTLEVAAASKVPKKKKPQTLSLAEFTTGKPVSAGSGSRLTSDELLVLPTGPRERSAEELERASSRGFGYSSYNSGGAGYRGRISGDESSQRRGGAGVNSRDIGPSRADEVDDWGKTKRSIVPERRERGTSNSFFDSQSRADDSDSWISNKATNPVAPPLEGRRSNTTSNWGFNKERDLSSETWGKRREELGTGSGERRKLVLQPRTMPPSNGEEPKVEKLEKISKGSNPFGAARPREEVLAEKGQDWRKLDEKLAEMKLEGMKVREEKSGFGKKSFGINGNGNGFVKEDRTERAWRKGDDSNNNNNDNYINSNNTGEDQVTSSEKIEENASKNETA